MNGMQRLCYGVLLILIGLLTLPVYAQDADFPRQVIDLTGSPVLIPVRPQIIAVVGEQPLPALFIPADHIRQIDPAVSISAVDWTGVGLLILPDYHAAAYPDLTEIAAAAGVPIFQMTPITSLDQWNTASERLAQASGYEARAADVLRRQERWYAAIRESVHHRPVRRVLILTPEGYTFGQDTLITDLIAVAGGVNVAAAANFDDFRQVDDAAIRALAPDVILLTPAWTINAWDALAANPSFAAVPAMRNQRVYRLPFRPAQPSNPAAVALMLAILLHPAAMPALVF